MREAHLAGTRRGKPNFRHARYDLLRRPGASRNTPSRGLLVAGQRLWGENETQRVGSPWIIDDARTNNSPRWSRGSSILRALVASPQSKAINDARWETQIHGARNRRSLKHGICEI